MSDSPVTKPPNRRGFLKHLGGAAALGAAGTVLPEAAKTAVPQQKVQYGMLIDTRRCIGCHACTVACKSEFDVPLGVNRSWVEYIEKGHYPNVDRSFLPRLCNQCSEPSCVDVCPTGATWKREEDGIVVVDEEICIGCKYCIQACPYGARFSNPLTGTADKCDFCMHRVGEGIEPSCVNTCMGRARIFGDINDPNSEISKGLSNNSTTVLRREMGTHPNVFYIAADHADENDMEYRNEYIRVTTNTKDKKRV
jgi:tetrathionate reductase subunit B